MLPPFAPWKRKSSIVSVPFEEPLLEEELEELEEEDELLLAELEEEDEVEEEDEDEAVI